MIHTCNMSCPVCTLVKGTRSLDETLSTLDELEKIQKHDQIEKLAIPTLNEYSLAPSHTHYVRLAEKINELIERIEERVQV